MNDIITIGGATEDIAFYTEEGILINNKKDLLRQKLLAFEHGAKINVDDFFSCFGGGAANTAVNFANFGFRVSTIVSIGDDYRGEMIINNFKKHKVNTELIHKIKNINSSFSFILIDKTKERIIFKNSGAREKLQINNKSLNKLKKTKWIYISSLAGKWSDNLEKVFKIVSKNKEVKIAWNPGQKQLESGFNNLKKYLSQTQVLCINKDEALELVLSWNKYNKKEIKFLNNIKNLLTIIYECGVKIIVITDGKNGAYTYDGQKFYTQKIIKEKKRVDTTGVGDSFGSSFIAGLEMYHNDIQKAMKLGVMSTASVISKQGAQNGLLTKF